MKPYKVAGFGPWGGITIDLEAVVAVTDPFFEDRMGSGGYFVGFRVFFTLRDEPITFRRQFEMDEYRHGRTSGRAYIMLEDGSEIESWQVEGSKSQPLALARVYEESVKPLLAAWEGVR